MRPTSGTAARQTAFPLAPHDSDPASAVRIHAGSSDSATDRTDDDSASDSSVVTISLSSNDSDDEVSTNDSADTTSADERGDADEPPVTAACWSDWGRLCSVRAGLELFSQTVGRLSNAALFVGLAQASPLAMRCLAGSNLALASGYCGYRLLKANVGTESAAQKLLVVAGTATFAGAGAAAAVFGSAAPLIALGVGGAFSTAYTLATRHRDPAASERPLPPHETQISAPLVFAASAGSTLLVGVAVPTLRMLDPGRLPRRSIALLAEAAVIEIAKGTAGSALPAVRTECLSLERRLKAAMIGLLPYALASLAFNAVAGNLLREQMKGDRFDHMMVPTLVGALANVVKGAVNTALLRCGGSIHCDASHRAPARPGACPKLPDVPTLLAKTALRFMIASGRDLLYLSLLDGGMEDMAAACTAYGLYAFFAQHRDLMFDLMKDEPWSEPRLRDRAALANA